jgi:UDPglucose--hexose-1-phosphate uridylyltransferase
VKRTSARLADGREIIYFDESDDSVRVLHDSRSLPATTTASEARYDAVLDEWVDRVPPAGSHPPPTDV